MHKLNKTDMHKQPYKHAYINSQNSSPPFLSIHQQRGENNQTIKMYMRYTFMKRRDVKLAPPAYMHYMEKG